jgi:nucleoside phosphorylase
MIVVLTALELEYKAVRAHLTDIEERRHRAGTRFEVGRLKFSPRNRIAIAATGMGNLPTATLTERVVAEFQPSAMLFAGIAGSLKSEWLRLGDVVVATKVYAYHGGRSEDEGLRSRPRSWETSHDVVQAARQLSRAKSWFGLLPEGQEPPDVAFEPIAAGDVVLASNVSAHAKEIADNYGDAAAVEMEGAGFAQAGHLNHAVQIGLVRGISDYADGTKSTTDKEGRQEIAAGNVAAFAIALAAVIDVPDDAEAAPGAEKEIPQFPSVKNKNVASGNARVGMQTGVNYGSFRGDST